jgi:hypothetical protein
VFRIGSDPGEEVSARLEAIGHDPARIDLVISLIRPRTRVLAEHAAGS